MLGATRPVRKPGPRGSSPFPGHPRVPGTAPSPQTPPLPAATRSSLFLPCASHLSAGRQPKGGRSLLLHGTSLSFLKAFQEACRKRFGVPGTARRPGCPALRLSDSLRGTRRVVSHNSSQLLMSARESPQPSPGYRRLDTKSVFEPSWRPFTNPHRTWQRSLERVPQAESSRGRGGLAEGRPQVPQTGGKLSQQLVTVPPHHGGARLCSSRA